MSINGSNPLTDLPPDERDLSLKQALEIAGKDWERLRHVHQPTWTISLTGSLQWRCQCTQSTPRNTDALVSHILTEVKRIRGPVRPPKK